MDSKLLLIALFCLSSMYAVLAAEETSPVNPLATPDNATSVNEKYEAQANGIEIRDKSGNVIVEYGKYQLLSDHHHLVTFGIPYVHKNEFYFCMTDFKKLSPIAWRTSNVTLRSFHTWYYTMTPEEFCQKSIDLNMTDRLVSADADMYNKNDDIVENWSFFFREAPPQEKPHFEVEIRDEQGSALLKWESNVLETMDHTIPPVKLDLPSNTEKFRFVLTCKNSREEPFEFEIWPVPQEKRFTPEEMAQRVIVYSEENCFSITARRSGEEYASVLLFLNSESKNTNESEDVASQVRSVSAQDRNTNAVSSGVHVRRFSGFVFVLIVGFYVIV